MLTEVSLTLNNNGGRGFLCHKRYTSVFKVLYISCVILYL